MQTYRPRIADQLLGAALRRAGAVQVVGPKWCGKTTTAQQATVDAVYFQDPDRRAGYQQLASVQPSALLAGRKPKLLDEWQDVPTVWDAVRFAVDRDPSPGQYVLTGSCVADSDEIKHTGTGRIAKVVMRPMTLFESGESGGAVSLAQLADGADIAGQGLGGIGDVAAAICRGGWPAALRREPDTWGALASDYVTSLVESDISRVDEVEKNPRRVRLLMRSLARNEATQAAMTTLAADMRTDEAASGNGLSTNTIAVYLAALRRLYVVDDQEAWAPAVRSKAAIRTSPVRRFCDPSIAAALLGLTPDTLVVDYSTFGLLFESLCVRDLRVYAEALGAGVFGYRDSRDLECDAIVEWPDGRWGAIEVKIDPRHADAAADTLLTVNRLVRSQHGGPPAFLAVVTATGFAYRRPDGVYVLPITCLAP
ncbi:MAG: DUF4143 domain-containing protein [Micrococcales bacterium]|nr:DUF4143 domain-containing protein [Micrococcales bacterium]MCL2668944.1 DUF4143 domain-containing protein [Micrococcales bacterium]